MLVRLLAVVALALAATGCAHSTGGVAPSTMPLDPDGYRVLGDVAGQDCVYYILGILPVSGGNETHHAVADALRERPGAIALINVTADTYWQHFIVFARVCTQVRGTAVAPK